MSCGGSHNSNANSEQISRDVREINAALEASGSVLRLHATPHGVAVASPNTQALARTWDLPPDAALEAEKQVYEYTYKRRWSTPHGRFTRAGSTSVTDAEAPELQAFAIWHASKMTADPEEADDIAARFVKRVRRDVEWERQAAADGEPEHSLPLSVRHHLRSRLDKQIAHEPGEPGSGPGTGFSVEADTLVDVFSRMRGGSAAYKTPDEWVDYLSYYGGVRPESPAHLLDIFYNDPALS